MHRSAQRKRGGSSVCLPCVWMSPKGTGELHPALSRVDTGDDDGSLDKHIVLLAMVSVLIFNGLLLGTLSCTT